MCLSAVDYKAGPRTVRHISIKLDNTETKHVEEYMYIFLILYLFNFSVVCISADIFIFDIIFL